MTQVSSNILVVSNVNPEGCISIPEFPEAKMIGEFSLNILRLMRECNKIANMAELRNTLFNILINDITYVSLNKINDITYVSLNKNSTVCWIKFVLFKFLSILDQLATLVENRIGSLLKIEILEITCKIHKEYTKINNPT